MQQTVSEMLRTARDIGHGEVGEASRGVGVKPWIKIRCDLWDDPRVSRICDLIGQTEALVVGALVRLWSLADLHSVDGSLAYTHATIDRKVGVQGFAQAAADVGWLDTSDSGGVVIPRFDKHNGTSAKQRAQSADRKRRERAGKSGSEDLSRNERDRNATRLDKMRTDEIRADQMRLENISIRADQMRLENISTRPDRTGPDDGERISQGQSQVANSSNSSNQAPGTKHKAPLTGRTFDELIELELVADLRDLPTDPIPGKLTGGVFAELLRPQIEHAPDGHWMKWYKEQLGARDPVLRRGTLAEMSVVLAAVYAARRLPQPVVRSSRLALWISWMKAENGSQITDEDLQRAGDVVRAARSRKAG